MFGEADKERLVFFISDRTGITVETIGHTLITQFPGIRFVQRTFPFVNTPEKAESTIKRINEAGARHGTRPIIFNTILDDELKAVIATAEGMHLDFFNMFLIPLEEELDCHSSHKSGLSHGMADEEQYMSRIDALNFSLTNDDGASTNKYPNADVILVGPSRSGKTPSCLYLALSHGINAANYPLTDADLEADRFPQSLRRYRRKLLGLTISAERLHNIREKRRPGSTYASLKQCQREIEIVEEIYQNEGVPTIDTSHMSIEEIATTIMQHVRGGKS